MTSPGTARASRLRALLPRPRVTIALVILALGTAVFWLTSRYPKLQEKQQSGDRVHIGEVLSHDVLLDVSQDDPVWLRVPLTAVNWVNTNLQGMSFGIFFGATFLTLLAYVSLSRRKRSPVLDAVFGTAIGAPLGVCVNCATPIGRGMHAAGMPPAMYLATIHASPTLNVVVLTMVWGLFPLEFFVVKVVTTVAFLLGVVPLVARWAPRPGSPKEHAGLTLTPAPADEPWLTALTETLRAFLRSLRYVARLTVPLMLAASVGGALLVESIPPGSFIGVEAGIATLAAVALFGTLLPVPMAFDVILAFILWRAGLPESLTMVLLFTLGIFSMFPFAVLWRQVSRKVATALVAAVPAAGLLSGLALAEYRRVHLDSTLELYDHAMTEAPLRELLTELCGRYPDAGDVERCGRALDELVAAQAAAPEICDELEDPDRVARCRGAVEARTVAQRGDVSACKGLDDSAAQVACVERVVSEHLAGGGGDELCPELRDEAAVRQCYEVAALHRARAESSPEPCHKLVEPARGRCLTLLVVTRLSQGDDPESCELLEDEAEQARCREAAADYVARARSERESCTGVTSEMLRHACERAVTASKLARGAGADACAGLARPADRAACLRDAAYAEVERTGSPDACDGVSDAFSKERCRSLAAERAPSLAGGLAACTGLSNRAALARCAERARLGAARRGGDASVCAPIADKAARERCGAAAALASAERTGDPGHCDSLEGTERERCLSSTVSRRAARDGDPAPCYGLAEPGARDQCKLRALDTIGRVVSARLAGQLADIEDLLASEGDTAAGEREASHPPEVAARRQWSETAAQGGHRVERTALSARRGGDAVRFTRLEGRDLGIDLGTQTVMVDYVEPLSHGRGIAAGDVDGDGWTDLAFATRRGVRLYRGLGPRGFAPVRVAQAGIRDKDVLLVALVDVDGDGSRDIFATTVGQGYYFLRNVRGSFEDQHLGFIWDPDVLLARAATFGDVDRNGRLDLVVGGWAPGREASLKLYRNGDEGFRPEALPSGGAAYAMTALLSDVTDDGSLDLLVGNDFEAPDWLLLGRESGGLEAVAVDSGTLPFTPIHTMSYDTGDVDNDGHSDIFATDLAFAGEVRDGDCGLIRHDEDRRRCEHNQRMERAIRQNDVRRCVEPGDGLSRNTCLAGALLYIATTSRLPALCDRMPRSEPGLRLLCEELAVSPLRSPEQNARLSLPRGVGFPQHQANVLLLGQGGERFAERGAALGVAKTSWSWSGKLADLDLDGWLDLYVVNGVGGFSVPEGAAYPSYFFKNRGDGSFTHDREAGLDDPLHGSAFVYVDFDGDGDLDIVVTGFNAPPRVFRNDTKTGGAILVELRDQRGNAFGVGSRITLHFEDGSSQYRELKLGGGYLSFDPTVAHFGVGARTRAVALTVRWSTGEAERIEGPFEAGFQYRVTRLR